MSSISHATSVSLPGESSSLAASWLDGGGDDDSRPSSSSNWKVLALYKFQRLGDTTSALIETTGSDPDDDDSNVLHDLKEEIRTFLEGHGALGNLLLAREGINGTICYPNTSRSGHGNSTEMTSDPVLHFLEALFPDLRKRASYACNSVFHRLRVRIKPEIVTMGVPGLDLLGPKAAIVPSCTTEKANATVNGYGVVFGCDRPGRYVKPEDWNELIRDPSTLLVDTRNEYEIGVGTFRHAINPHTANFVEFPAWVERVLLPGLLFGQPPEQQEQEPLPETPSASDERLPSTADSSTPKANLWSPREQRIRKIAFVCTGGIRCEKATAHVQRLLRRHQDELLPKCCGAGEKAPAVVDMPEVYHLEGGILAYLDSVPREESLFDGECYVFDNRVAVAHGLAPTTRFRACRACRHPLSVKDDNDSEIGCNPGFDGTQASGGGGESADCYREWTQCRYCAADPDRQERRGRYEMRHRQMLAAERRGRTHLGSSSTEAVCMKQKKSSKLLAN